jgi:hypothetical protein
MIGLPTICKNIVSIINKRKKKYIDDKKLLPKEEKGRGGGPKECKDQLPVSKVVFEECKSRRKTYAYKG